MDALNGIRDCAIAGATAKIALQRRGKIAPLGLVERRRGHNRTCRAEPALETLRIEERLLNRVKVVRRAEPFDRRDFLVLCPKGRHEAAVHGPSVDVNRTGATVARVAALLHAEEAKIPQERAQTLARPRDRLWRSCRQRDRSCPFSKLFTDFLREKVRHMLAPVGQAMNVVIIERVRNIVFEAALQFAGAFWVRECELHRSARRSGDREHEAALGRERTDEKHARAT